MAFNIGEVSFDGYRGTIQRPKPVFDRYTRLGSDRVYVQRLRTEAAESSIEAWALFDSLAECMEHERSLADIVGLPQIAILDAGVTLNGCRCMDYDHTIKAGANSKFLITYNLKIVTDESTEEEGGTNE